jgi:hypothetical protein
MAIAHANTDLAIRDPETRDAQLVNALDMALDLDWAIGGPAPSDSSPPSGQPSARRRY